MFLELIEAIASCLDRESARRLVNVDLNEQIERHLRKVATGRRAARSTSDAVIGDVIDRCAIEFFSQLQRKARAVLRQPGGAGGSSKKP